MVCRLTIPGLWRLVVGFCSRCFSCTSPCLRDTVEQTPQEQDDHLWLHVLLPISRLSHQILLEAARASQPGLEIRIREILTSKTSVSKLPNANDDRAAVERSTL